MTDFFNFNLDELSDILLEVNEKSRKLVQSFLDKQQQSSHIDQAEAATVGKSFQELAVKLMADPNQLFDSQMSYWEDYWGLVQKSSLQLLGGMPAQEEDEKPDKRFRHEAWSANPMFMVQDQNETLATSMLNQASWLPEEGKKAIREWVDAFKKGREEYKKTVDEAFKKVEEYQ